MKIKHELAILNYSTGVNTKGKTWHMLQAKDEDGYNFSLFGEKAKDYKDLKNGEIKELNIEIKTYFDRESKTTKTIYILI